MKWDIFVIRHNQWKVRIINLNISYRGSISRQNMYRPETLTQIASMIQMYLYFDTKLNCNVPVFLIRNENIHPGRVRKPNKTLPIDLS